MALFKRREEPVNLDNPANNPLVLRPAPQISSAVTTHIIL
jgi:hypothetical protein